METLKAAVIGCGKIGSIFADDPNRDKLGVYSHAEAYSLSERAELVAVCDTNIDLARACGERWGVDKVYTNTAELIDRESLDLVSICTPDETHFDVAMMVLKATSLKGLLVEKPLSQDASSAGELIQLAASRSVKLAVNYSRRYSDSFRKLKVYLDSGGIGEIQAIRGFYTKGLKHNGSHWVDLLRFLTGEVELMSVLSATESAEPDPTLDVMYRMSGGGIAVLQGLDHKNFSLFEMDIVGTKGRVKIEDSGHCFSVYDVVPSKWYEGYFTLELANNQIEGGMRDVTLNAVENLIDAVQGKSDLKCSGQQALQAILLTDLTAS